MARETETGLSLLRLRFRGGDGYFQTRHHHPAKKNTKIRHARNSKQLPLRDVGPGANSRYEIATMTDRDTGVDKPRGSGRLGYRRVEFPLDPFLSTPERRAPLQVAGRGRVLGALTSAVGVDSAVAEGANASVRT